MATGHSYSDEEVEAILRRAIERQVQSGDGLDHEDLVDAAREVGLDAGAVERAIEELRVENSGEAIRATLRRRRREKWLRHLVSFVAVVGGLLGMHALGLAGAWVFWVAFGWGIGFVLDTYSKLRRPTDEEVAREEHRLNRHARRREQARARQEAKRRRHEERAKRYDRRHQRSQASEQLERVIEEGVTLLLGAAARKLSQANEEKPPRTDFEHFVARKKAQSRGAVVTPPPREPPRVRVEPEDEERAPYEVERDRERTSHRAKRDR